MKFLKNNMVNILILALMFTVTMLGDASASAFDEASNRLNSSFNNAKMIIFVLGGLALIGLSIFCFVVTVLPSHPKPNKYGPVPDGVRTNQISDNGNNGTIR